MDRESRTTGENEQGDERGFARKVLISVLIATVVVLFLLLIGKVFHLILLVFAGVLIAIFLRGSGTWVSTKVKLPPKLCQLFVLLGLLLAGFGFVWLVSPQVNQQFQELVEEFPRAYQSFQEMVQGSEWAGQLLRQLPEPQDLFSQLGGLLKRAGGIFSTTLGILSSFVIIIFVGLYLAFEPDMYIKGVLHLVPKGKRDRAGEVLSALNDTLLDWMIARFVGMTVVGVLTWIGLMVLGIPMALTLGLLAALLTFIPNIGPIISVIPAALLGLSQGWHLAPYVLALYAAIQIVESYIITPLVQQFAVSLPPVFTITFQIVLGILAGILGLVLATPLAAVVLVLTQMIYVHDILGDRSFSNSKESSGRRHVTR